MEQIIEKIGKDTFNKLDRESEKEIGLALKMPIKDEYGQDNYYRARYLLPELVYEFEFFEQEGLKITPMDIINILFKCKILFKVKDENEYRQRIGCISQVDEYDFAIPWIKREGSLDKLVNEYINKLEEYQYTRILLVELKSYNIHDGRDTIEELLNQLLKEIKYPACIYKDFEKDNKNLFLGFKTSGTYLYSYFYSSAKLRILLSMLRISGYISPAQKDFGREGINIIAPRLPTFLDKITRGMSRYEDRKEAREKIPDGDLRLSFGYRGIAKFYLDSRNFESIKYFFIKYGEILNISSNPRTTKNIKVIAPVIDILNTVTQTFDLGSKILLLNCCLENLFVPSNISNNQKSYIIGGINALDPRLNDWFKRLYNIRCEYAHNGFIKSTDETSLLITDSIKNIIELLNKKLQNMNY